jgi:hypothetical protein
MSRQLDDGKTQRRAGAEFLLFLIASAVGICSLGQGLSGLFELGQGISLLWLAVTGVAIIILFAQMGRVQDTWPRRRTGEAQPTKEAAQKLPVPSEER